MPSGCVSTYHLYNCCFLYQISELSIENGKHKILRKLFIIENQLNLYWGSDVPVGELETDRYSGFEEGREIFRLRNF